MVAKLQLDTKNKLSVELCNGAFGVRNELDKFTRCVPGLALRKIRWDRYCGAAHLSN